MKAFRVLFPFLHFFSKFDLKKFIVEVMTSCMTPNKTMKTLTLPQRVKRFPVLQTHVPWPCFCRWLHIFGGLLLFSVPGARSRLSIQCFSSFSYNLKKKKCWVRTTTTYALPVYLLLVGFCACIAVYLTYPNIFTYKLHIFYTLFYWEKWPNKIYHFQSS